MFIFQSFLCFLEGFIAVQVREGQSMRESGNTQKLMFQGSNRVPIPTKEFERVSHMSFGINGLS